jgi:uncharacterized protein (TIGR00296 family)
MLQLDEGKLAISYTRKTIHNYLNKTKNSTYKLTEIFLQKSGVFVTLHTYPQQLLRGCIGIPYPIMSLQKAIEEAAISVIHDPRFPSLTKEELPDILLEVTILSPPTLIKVSDPQDYNDKIKIGRDGLIVEKGYFKGLLLPQVPIEQDWDIKEFLAQTCIKAGLPLDSWIDKDTKIYQFNGQIFNEVTPNGEVREKKINGSNN